MTAKIAPAIATSEPLPDSADPCAIESTFNVPEFVMVREAESKPMPCWSIAPARTKADPEPAFKFADASREMDPLLVTRSDAVSPTSELLHPEHVDHDLGYSIRGGFGRC